MKLPKFEDKHPKHTAEGYAATNEEPEAHRKLISNKRFKRAASIASGGEIPYCVLLSRSDEVVAVDHSYRAIIMCYLKAVLLNTLGPRGMKALFVESSYEDVKAVLLEAAKLMPQVLQDKVNWADKQPYYDYYSESANRRYSVLSISDIKYLRREAFFTPLATLEAVVKRLDQVTLVHGDLSDLKLYGGNFDILYASNAMGHTNRDKKYPTFSQFEELVKPDGYILMTTGYGTKTDPKLPTTLKEIKRISGLRSDWDHVLLQKAVKNEPAKETTQAEAQVSSSPSA
jgi:hypothetical protein